MTYELAFVASALKEWRKLATPIREQFKNKLGERLRSPKVPSARLHGMPDQVDDGVLLVTVVAVGKREKGVVYSIAGKRLK